MSCRCKGSLYVYVESKEIECQFKGTLPAQGKGELARLKHSHLRGRVGTARGVGENVHKLFLLIR